MLSRWRRKLTHATLSLFSSGNLWTACSKSWAHYRFYHGSGFHVRSRTVKKGCTWTWCTYCYIAVQCSAVLPLAFLRRCWYRMCKSALGHYSINVVLGYWLLDTAQLCTFDSWICCWAPKKKNKISGTDFAPCPNGAQQSLFHFGKPHRAPADCSSASAGYSPLAATHCAGVQHDVDSYARGTAVGYDDGHGRGGDARARRTRDARRYA